MQRCAAGGFSTARTTKWRWKTRQNCSRLAHSTPVPKTIFSGIQPTGIPHLGNYLGALSSWVELQNTAAQGDKLLFSIVDLHALTVEAKPTDQSIRQGTLDMAAALLAVGIDPERSTLFCQSQVPHHSRLAWILSCVTPLGKLNRMTTWKSKLVASRNANSEDEVDESLLNVGLYTYPVLQAADILLYQATHVPVGEDQRQHLELSRDITSFLNRRIQAGSSSFALQQPQPLISDYKRILSLRDPTQKMSKSAPDANSRILLTDSFTDIRRKISGAVTDSNQGPLTFDPVQRPGVSNLLTILSGLSGKGMEDVVRQCHELNLNHGGLKKLVVEAIEEKMKRPRDEFNRLQREEGYLKEVLQKGAGRASGFAEETLRAVHDALGLDTLRAVHDALESPGSDAADKFFWRPPSHSLLNHLEQDDAPQFRNSHPELAKSVAERLNVSLTPCIVNKFSNGEIGVKIKESVRDEDVFIIQSGCGDVNDNLMELLILVSACRTASARRITAIIPCFPYARQDRKESSRAPITAKLVANMLVGAGCDHVVTLDLHASQIQGFFDVPVDNLYSEPLMIGYIKREIEGWKDAVVVSPDAGGAKRVTAIADKLGIEFALIHRQRNGRAKNAPEKMELLVGDVRGKVAILVDDMVDTGKTLTLAARTLEENGAAHIYALVSHGLLAESNLASLSQLPFDRIVVTNTVPQHKHQAACSKLTVIDVAPLLAESIRRTHNGESISLLFGDWADNLGGTC